LHRESIVSKTLFITAADENYYKSVGVRERTPAQQADMPL
jgi:hypothetical protein